MSSSQSHDQQNIGQQCVERNYTLLMGVLTATVLWKSTWRVYK